MDLDTHQDDRIAYTANTTVGNNTWTYTGWGTTTNPPSTWYPVIQGGSDPAPDTGDDTGDDNPDDTGDDAPDEPKTFTQEQVNAIAAREASKAARGKLDPKEYGFDSAKDLKEFLDAAKAKTEADKDEATKELEARIAEAREQAKSEVLGTAKQIALKAGFTVAATKANVIDPDGAYLLAQSLEGWDEVQVGDDGTVTGLDDAFFEAFKESKPYLFSSGDGDQGSGDGTRPPRVNPGATGAGGGDADTEQKKLLNRYPALQHSGVAVPRDN